MTRHAPTLSLASCLIGATFTHAAAAQEPAPQAPPAQEPAAPGEPVPVAPESPVTPATPADLDRSLADVLSILFDPGVSAKTRSEALSDPALADPRAAGPLTFLLNDREAEVRAGAARALARFAAASKIENALIRVLRESREVLAVRTAAADALGKGGGPMAGDALYDVYEDDGEGVAMRTAARAALEARFPALLARAATTEIVDRGGRALISLGGAALGSYGFAAVGALGRNDAGIAIGALGGALLGGGTAFFVTRSGEITRAQAASMVSGGLWGAYAGMLTSGIVERDPSTRLTMGLGLVGEGLGFGAAFATRKGMTASAGDVAVMNFGGLLGLDLTGGALLMGNGDNEQLGLGLLLGGTALGLAGGAAVAPHLRFRHGDALLVADSSYEGVMFGWQIAAALDASGRRTSGASYLGLGLGFAGGAALAQARDLRAADVAFIFAAGTYGKIVGLSIPMVADAGDQAVSTGVIAGSAASLLAGHLLAERLHFEGGSLPFIGLATGWGLWHGGAIAESTTGLTGRQQAGAVWLGGSAAGLGAMALSQGIDLSGTEVLALTGGFFWGTWFSVWGSMLNDLDETTRLRTTLVAGDAGLAAAALLVSPLVDVDPRRMGIANLGGLAGAGTASLVAALATKNDDTVITANLIGSGVGLLGGALLAASLDLSPRKSRSSATSGSSASSWLGSSVAALGGHLPTPHLFPMVMVADPRARAGAAATVGLGVAFFDP